MQGTNAHRISVHRRSVASVATASLKPAKSAITRTVSDVPPTAKSTLASFAEDFRLLFVSEPILFAEME